MVQELMTNTVSVISLLFPPGLFPGLRVRQLLRPPDRFRHRPFKDPVSSHLPTARCTYNPCRACACLISPATRHSVPTPPACTTSALPCATTYPPGTNRLLDDFLRAVMVSVETDEAASHILGQDLAAVHNISTIMYESVRFASWEMPLGNFVTLVLLTFVLDLSYAHASLYVLAVVFLLRFCRRVIRMYPVGL
jgi:hypothetical protein